jgi:hypothetical protein
MGPIGISETSVLTNLRHVITKKTEEFNTTAAEAHDVAWLPQAFVPLKHSKVYSHSMFFPHFIQRAEI